MAKTLIGNIKGPQGDTGNTGATGATGATGPAGPGVPNGGNAGDMLVKNSADNQDTKWIAPRTITEIVNLQNALGIVVDGKQSAVSAAIGQFVILKNSTITGVTDGLYTAAKAITANTDIDGTYLTAVSKGGLNSLNDRISSLNEQTTKKYVVNVNSASDLSTVLASLFAAMNVNEYASIMLYANYSLSPTAGGQAYGFIKKENSTTATIQAFLNGTGILYGRTTNGASTWTWSTESITDKNKKITMVSDEATISSGYVSLSYPTGCTRFSHYYQIIPTYTTGYLTGWTATMQANTNDIIGYIRQGTTTPGDNTKISFILICYPI